jgi:hypothetical protein
MQRGLIRSVNAEIGEPQRRNPPYVLALFVVLDLIRMAAEQAAT